MEKSDNRTTSLKRLPCLMHMIPCTHQVATKLAPIVGERSHWYQDLVAQDPDLRREWKMTWES